MKLNEEIVAAKALTCRFNSEEALLRQELEVSTLHLLDDYLLFLYV